MKLKYLDKGEAQLVAKALSDAADLVEISGHCKGRFQFRSPRDGSWHHCAVGAIDHEARKYGGPDGGGYGGDSFLVRTVGVQAVSDELGFGSSDPFLRVTQWNDRRETRKIVVARTLRRAAKRVLAVAGKP